MFIEKVYIGLDHAPPAFDLRARILGQGGTNLDFIRNETGAVVILKGGVFDKFEPMHLFLQHTKQDALASARLLALNLVDTVKQELQQWSGGNAPPPSNNAPAQFDQPPPPIVQNNAQIASTAAPPVPPPVIQAFTPQQQLVPINQATNNPSVVAVRPQYIQVLPHQPVMLAPLQDGSQQYVISNQGSTILNPGSAIAMPIQSAQFSNNTVDISSLQQVRLGTTIPTFIQNGIALSQMSNTSSEQQNQNPHSFQTVEVANPSVCTAPTLHSSSQQVYVQASSIQPQVVSGEKTHDGKEQVQWLPTPVYIPYQYQQGVQQTQQIIAVPQGIPASLSNLNVWPTQLGTSQMMQNGTVVPIQLSAHITPTSTTVVPAQQQMQQINAWQTSNQVSTSSVQNTTNPNVTTVNVWSTGTRTLPNVQSIAAKQPPNKQTWPQLPQQANSAGIHQDSRGMKRNSDGNTLSLRPIAPAGSLNPNEQRNQQQPRDTKQKLWNNQTGNISGNPRLNPRIQQEVGGNPNHNYSQMTQIKHDQNIQDHQNLRSIQENNAKFTNYEGKFSKIDTKEQPNQNDEKHQQPPSSPNIPAYVIPRNPEQFNNQTEMQPQYTMPTSNPQHSVSTLQLDNQGGQITLHAFDSNQIPANTQYHFIPNQVQSGNHNQTYAVMPPNQPATQFIQPQQMGAHATNQPQYLNSEQFQGLSQPNQNLRPKFNLQNPITANLNTQNQQPEHSTNQNYAPPNQMQRFSGNMMPNQHHGLPQNTQMNQNPNNMSSNQYSNPPYGNYGSHLHYPPPTNVLPPPTAGGAIGQHSVPPPSSGQPASNNQATNGNFYWQNNNSN